jgi:hypothetical protein
VRRAALAAAILAAVILGAGASLFAAQANKPKSKAAPVPAIDESLPMLGTQLAELPAGPGKAAADAGCLNEKQWGASVTKMVGWGADVPDAKRDELIAYLVKNFGPDNDRFKPVVTRPVGR